MSTTALHLTGVSGIPFSFSAKTELVTVVGFVRFGQIATPGIRRTNGTNIGQVASVGVRTTRDGASGQVSSPGTRTGQIAQ